MSDGLSDAAYAAHAKAIKFCHDRYPGIKVVEWKTKVPRMGKVILVYEEWLDHVVEVIVDDRVQERWMIGCVSTAAPRRLTVSESNCSTGYYADHRVED